jgi:serine/threonine-protein kinase
MDGEELGPVLLFDKIGEGGIGRVYKAWDKHLDRFVGIKLPAEAQSADADRRARFGQKAEAASAVNHPKVIAIHEIGQQDRQIYVGMELVDGKPHLNDLISLKACSRRDQVVPCLGGRSLCSGIP